MDFDRELRLRRAEAAKRPVRRCVGHRRASVDADVIAPVGSARVDDAARQHHGAERRIRAGVEHRVNLHRGETPGARDARAVPDDGRMPLRRRQHVLDTVVNQLHGAARLAREQRRMARDHRRILFLAAEAAAGFGLDDAKLVVGQIEQHLERPMHVVGTLHRPVHRHLAVRPRHRDDAVGLDVELLLEPDAVLAFDDGVGRGKTAREVALFDHDFLECLSGSLRVIDGVRRPILDCDPRVHELFFFRVREKQNRFRDVAHPPLGQARLVVLYERDDVPSGNVAEVHDRETVALERATDGKDIPARYRRADRRAVEHPRKREIVHVPGRAGDLGDSLLAGDSSSDGRHSLA